MQGILLGDFVLFRRGELGHEMKGRVVGRTFGRNAIYNVETEDKNIFSGITIIRLDED